jgi:xanthine dehydrogenase iron-sulfur cluster and FAD-binding subunit A
MLNLRLVQPKHVVDISRLGELCDSSISGDTLTIGARVTHAQIEDGRILHITRSQIPDLNRERIRTELAGDLCRCTGYLSIITAIEDVHAQGIARKGSSP